MDICGQECGRFKAGHQDGRLDISSCEMVAVGGVLLKNYQMNGTGCVEILLNLEIYYGAQT